MGRTRLEESERIRRRLMTHRKYEHKLESICFHFNRFDDADVIEWLKSRPVMINAVRELVRAAIKKEHDI